MNTPLHSPISYVHQVCDKGSLADLRDDVAAQGQGHIDFLCVQDPDSVIHLLCVDDPTNKACQLATAHSQGELHTYTATHRAGEQLTDVFPLLERRKRRALNSQPNSLM